MGRVYQGRAPSAAVAERTGRRSYYDLLQISTQAGDTVLQAAYRALARLYHPDLSQIPTAAQEMRELNEAYETLSEPRRRAIYDLGLKQHRFDAESDARSGLRRRTACWRCSDVLGGSFARYCGTCRWLVCEICHGCGCQHPEWQARLAGRSRLLAAFCRPVVALSGWALAVVSACWFLARLVI